MNWYELKVWIQVAADTEDEAQSKLEAALENFIDGEFIVGAAVEGEGSIYPVEEES